MIGFLRFVGVLNVAVWLGTAVFFLLAAGPAASSAEMKELLGPRNSPYFTGAIAHLLAGRFYQVQFICGIIALLHLLAEWLYFGKSPRRSWLGLLVGLILLSLAGGLWLQPKLRELHTLRFTRPDRREMTDRSFRAWHAVSSLLNFVSVAGLAVYLWRVTNPPDPTRFVSAAKFRG